MFLVNRLSEPRNCPLCSRNYDASSNKPESLIPCGHTYCSNCIVNLKRECKLCGISYNQIIPDYDMLDMIKQTKKISLNSNNDINFSENEV